MQVFGLLGNPVSHSLSPLMHEVAYEDLGIDARYVTFEVPPENLPTAITGADALGISGLNVTVPYKRDVLELVEPDPLSRRVGAVNTVDFSGDKPTGHNTDVAGVRRAFSHHGVSFDGRTAVVVGAGGAGRASAFALAEEGTIVRIANRTVARADELAEDVTSTAERPVTAHPLDALTDLLSDADLLVNATTVGMDGDRSPVPKNALHAGLTVLDAVYTPIQTRLLEDASATGATTIDGAWMLLYQGIEAFELWTGKTPPVAEMNSALRARL